MGVLGGLGVLVWGGLLFGFFNGYLGFGPFRRGTRLVLGTTAIALLVTLVGVHDSLVGSRLGRAILIVMGTVLLVTVAGVLIGFANPDIGTSVVIASYVGLVASGTFLGIPLLRSGGPRVAAWSLAVSGPVFLLTDKLLWEPSNALLGIDITAFLNTGPLAVGLILLGRSIRERSEPVESG